MALIKCPECNKEISDTSKTCIHCGYKIKGQTNFNKNILIFIGIIITMIIIFVIINNTNRKEKLESCYNTDYFYKIIQDKIHDEYWQYDFLDIEYCNSQLLNGTLEAWCHFKYKDAINKDYSENEISETFSCTHEK